MAKFLFRVFMDRAILTEQAWSINWIYYMAFEEIFHAGYSGKPITAQDLAHLARSRS